jgi:hypothetical protein
MMFLKAKNQLPGNDFLLRAGLCFLQLSWTFSAWKPLGPLVTENATAWRTGKLRDPPA